MSWNLRDRFATTLRFGGTLAFRLTAWYAIAGLVLVVFASAGLYLVLVTELDKSTDLFLADKLHVLGTMLRERPDDWDALREEIELESAARRYQQFYIRLSDQRHSPLLTTPGMAELLDLPQLTAETENHRGHTLQMKGRTGHLFSVTSAILPVGTGT